MANSFRTDPRQIDLVDWLAGKVRTSDPVTSRRAASRVNVRRLNTLILRALRSVGPMTTEEISKVIRRSLQSVTPRMSPLVQKGLVRNSGKTRPGLSQRERIVWELVDAKDQGSEASRVDQNARVPDLRGAVAGASPDDQSTFSHGAEERR